VFMWHIKWHVWRDFVFVLWDWSINCKARKESVCHQAERECVSSNVYLIQCVSSSVCVMNVPVDKHIDISVPIDSELQREYSIVWYSLLQRELQREYCIVFEAQSQKLRGFKESTLSCDSTRYSKRVLYHTSFKESTLSCDRVNTCISM